MKEIYNNLGKYSPKDLKLADLHFHTNVSDGALMPEQAVDKAMQEGLNAIAITDHDSVRGAERAWDYCQKNRYDFEVVMGSEITANDFSHIGALFIQAKIPSGKTIKETIREIHNQKGLAVAFHPVIDSFAARLTGLYLTEDKIKSVAQDEDPDINFDGFEIYNAGINKLKKGLGNFHIIADYNLRAYRYYLREKENLGAATGGSDGHYYTVGEGLTGYRDDLKKAIRSAETAVFSIKKDDNPITLTDRMNRSVKSIVCLPARRVYDNFVPKTVKEE